MASLESIADELYALPLGDFVDSRNQRAKCADERQLASAVRALKKPSVAAWVVNVLARERQQFIGEVLELGARLRAARGALDGAALQSLSAERRVLLSRAADLARDVASLHGKELSLSALTGLDGTLRCAMADADAGRAVEEGRLVVAMDAIGMGQVDLTGVVALPGPVITTRASVRSHSPDLAIERRRQLAAGRKAVTQAEAAVSAVSAAQTTLERLVEQRTQIESELGRVHDELMTMAEGADAVRTAISASKQTVLSATKELEKARTTLAALG